jgi:hypothetical protein
MKEKKTSHPPIVVPGQPPTVQPRARLGAADEIRFLEQATWGPTSRDIAHLKAIGIAGWLSEQFQMPASSYPPLPSAPLDLPVPCDAGCFRDTYTPYPVQTRFFLNALYGPDQLRQRVTFALHQLLVTSGTLVFPPSWMAPYLQTLVRNAFGNYRQLLYEITLNPAMGYYLNMSTSTKDSPNENYAREIMQLFSIGLNLLNSDGTPQRDASGVPIPTYDQTAVTELARVFTGWSIPHTSPETLDFVSPMLFTPADHDTGRKTIVGGVVIPEGQTGEEDLNQAIDALFRHPNVGPYLATHFIHNFVTSNPSPAYVKRVADVFNDNGVGVRGDLKAVVEAVLLDTEARGDTKTAPDYGHLKQSVLFLTNLLRAFEAKSADLTGPSDGVLDSLTALLDQDIFVPPSVFSYYPASFLVPGTQLLGPEFGIFSATTSLRKANLVHTLVFGNIPAGPDSPNGTALDFSPWLMLAGNPPDLLFRLNQLMMHGAMPMAMETSMVDAVSAVSATNPLRRVQHAVYLIATSSQYQVGR